MGFTRVRVVVESLGDSPVRREVDLLVDTGALYSILPAKLLRDMGIQPQQRLPFELADGSTIERAVGEVRFHYDGRNGVSRVIFGEEGDADVLGVVALETMGLEVDPVRKVIRPAKLILY
jgi:aspartyl protease family protein